MSGDAEELGLVAPDGTAVRFTSGDKVYFPRLGAAGPKRALADYYLTVTTASGGPLLRALRDRPTHLQRFPDGIEGPEVYQKRLPRGHPEWLRSCRVTFPSARTADVLTATRPADVLWA